MTALTLERDTSSSPALDGVREMVPAAVGVLPFATMIGVAIGNSPIAEFVGWVSGLVVAGGSAHLAITASVTVGAGFFATVATALLINSRTLIYGALLGPALRTQPRWFRWVAAYALVDQLYAMVSAVTDRDERYVRSYYLGGMVVLWPAYMAGVAAGIILGPVIPASIPLAMAIPILFLAMITPSLKDRPAKAAAVAAMSAAIVGSALPAGMGMIAGIGAGVLVGALVEARTDA